VPSQVRDCFGPKRKERGWEKGHDGGGFIEEGGVGPSISTVETVAIKVAKGHGGLVCGG